MIARYAFTRLPTSDSTFLRPQEAGVWELRISFLKVACKNSELCMGRRRFSAPTKRPVSGSFLSIRRAAVETTLVVTSTKDALLVTSDMLSVGSHRGGGSVGPRTSHGHSSLTGFVCQAHDKT
ncbi:hypothetical protein MRX96_002858 [Rhipicephalus microplus]